MPICSLSESNLSSIIRFSQWKISWHFCFVVLTKKRKKIKYLLKKPFYDYGWGCLLGLKTCAITFMQQAYCLAESRNGKQKITTFSLEPVSDFPFEPNLTSNCSYGFEACSTSDKLSTDLELEIWTRFDAGFIIRLILRLKIKRKNIKLLRDQRNLIQYIFFLFFITFVILSWVCTMHLTFDLDS